MADVTTKIATIAAGQNTSYAVDLGDNSSYVGIIFPAGWTTAGASFLACETIDGTFKNVYNSSGTELTVTSNAANRAIQTISGLECFRYVKIRSGSASSPVTQVGRQEVLFVVKG